MGRYDGGAAFWYAPIQQHFPAAPCFLEVYTYPEEGNDQELLLAIGTSGNVDEALAALDWLDAAWWLPNLAWAQGQMVINVEFQ